jgi:hypothetical protein
VPALPSAANVIRNILRFTVSEDGQAAIRFFLKYSGTSPSNAQLATFAAGVGAAYAAQLQPLASEGVILTDVKSTDLTSSTSGEGSSAEDVTGTRSGDPVDAATCLLESLHVDRRYRGGHPRVYWPFGVSTDLLTRQTWTDAFIAACATNLEVFYGTIAELTWTGGTIIAQVNVSFYEGFTNRAGPTGRERAISTPRASAVIDTIDGSVVQQGIASQRRRLLALA